MKKNIVKTFPIALATNLAEQGNTFLGQVLDFCPKCLGIDPRYIESITIEHENNKEAQLVNLSIKFITGPKNK